MDNLGWENENSSINLTSTIEINSTMPTIWNNNHYYDISFLDSLINSSLQLHSDSSIDNLDTTAVNNILDPPFDQVSDPGYFLITPENLGTNQQELEHFNFGIDRNKKDDDGISVILPNLSSSTSGGESEAASSGNRHSLKRKAEDKLGYEPDTDAIAQVKEMMYRAAALRPVINLGLEEAAPEKFANRKSRKNVRISSDPQTVAARERRERISDRLRILQKMVPGGSKMDTASMLDEAANYLKFLKTQVTALETLDIPFGAVAVCPSFEPSVLLRRPPKNVG